MLKTIQLSPSSTSTRIKAWEATAELAKKNWLFGLGTGHGGKELNKIYRDKGYFSLKRKISILIISIYSIY